jgi:hypothetical protein
MKLDCSMLTASEEETVRRAIAHDREADAVNSISDKRLEFSLANYLQLKELGILERNWIAAYVHASNFDGISLSRLQAIFDACNRTVLQENFPIQGSDRYSNYQRFSLFRGCAGPDHRKGMSWTSSLDTAIRYATRHAAIHAAHHPGRPKLDDVAVYAALVDRSEIYCCVEHYDLDYIVHPAEWWRVDVPAEMFRLERR